MEIETQLKVSAEAAFQTADKNTTHVGAGLHEVQLCVLSRHVYTHSGPTVPVLWVSSFWQTQACCWPAGTALWGQTQYNSESQMTWWCSCCEPHLPGFSRREKGRQPVLHTWALLWNRVSSHPRKVGQNTCPDILISTCAGIQVFVLITKKKIFFLSSLHHYGKLLFH